MSISRALYLKEKFGAFELGTTPVPAPGPGEILVREVAVALNPVDWKIQVYGVIVSDYPVILGRDGAGEVEAVGEGVTQFKKGDKVFHQGSLTAQQYGTFQEYAVVTAEIAAKLPANITLDQAASLPLGVGTVVIGLYSPSPGGAGVRPPWDGGSNQYAGQPALILGGASSVGQYAIQFARLSGFSPIITSASLRNTDLLKSLGASHVIDRNLSASAFASEIACITSKQIPLVFDSVSSLETQQRGYDAVAEGGHLIIVLPSSIEEAPGSTKKVLQVFGGVYKQANRAIGRDLAQNLPVLLGAGDVVPNPIEVVPGGLNGIVSGLERLRNNLVSAKKLVVRPGETL